MKHNYQNVYGMVEMILCNNNMQCKDSFVRVRVFNKLLYAFSCQYPSANERCVCVLLNCLLHVFDSITKYKRAQLFSCLPENLKLLCFLYFPIKISISRYLHRVMIVRFLAKESFIDSLCVSQSINDQKTNCRVIDNWKLVG